MAYHYQSNKTEVKKLEQSQASLSGYRKNGKSLLFGNKGKIIEREANAEEKKGRIWKIQY